MTEARSEPLRIFGAHDGEKYQSALEMAIEAGYRHIDTAQMYGNENVVGEVLEAAGELGKQISVTTKVLPSFYSEEKFIPSVKKSLNHLRRDRADALLLHWPPLDGSSIEPSLELLIKAYEDGLAKRIGVSNYTPAMLRHAKEFCPVPLVCNQIEFHPLLDQSAILAASEETGVVLTGYCSLAHGGVLKKSVLAEIGKTYGKTAAQVALRWIIHKGVSPITGSADPKHIKQNFDCLDFELDDFQINRIDELAAATNLRIVKQELRPGVSMWDDEIEQQELEARAHAFKELKIGDWFKTDSRPIDAAMIDAFAELSGDRFPIHMDKNEAKKGGFADRVAHGLLVMAVIDGLKNQAKTQFEAVATRAWSWDFTAPVLCGDKLSAKVVVVGKRTTTNGDGLLELEMEVYNQRDEKLQTGRNTLLVKNN